MWERLQEGVKAGGNLLYCTSNILTSLQSPLSPQSLPLSYRISLHYPVTSSASTAPRAPLPTVIMSWSDNPIPAPVHSHPPPNFHPQHQRPHPPNLHYQHTPYNRGTPSPWLNHAPAFPELTAGDDPWGVDAQGRSIDDQVRSRFPYFPLILATSKTSVWTDPSLNLSPGGPAQALSPVDPSLEHQRLSTSPLPSTSRLLATVQGHNDHTGAIQSSVRSTLSLGSRCGVRLARISPSIQWGSPPTKQPTEWPVSTTSAFRPATAERQCWSRTASSYAPGPCSSCAFLPSVGLYSAAQSTSLPASRSPSPVSSRST